MFQIHQDFVEVINQAEGAIHDIESKIDEYKDQLPADEVRRIVLFYVSYCSVVQVRKTRVRKLYFKYTNNYKTRQETRKDTSLMLLKVLS